MILVTGATGSVGRAAVRRLVANGRAVRGLVRDSAAAAELEASGVSALVGDVTRATDRAAALIGVDAVIACHSAFHQYDALRVMAIDGEATEALIADAAAAGVKHFTLLSLLHCDLPSHSQRFKAKLRAEQALQRQDRMPFTILRLPPLFDALLHLPGIGDLGDQRTLLEFGDGLRLVTPMSPDDAAQMAIEAQGRAATFGQTLDVGGPETYTWKELPGLLEQAWGENVVCWRLPFFVLTFLRAVLGLIRPTAGDRLGYVETLYSHDFAVDPADAAAAFGIGLDDLVSWLRRDGEPAAAPPDLSQERPPARSVEPEPTQRLDELEADYPTRAPEPLLDIDSELEREAAGPEPIVEPLPRFEIPEPEPEPEPVAPEVIEPVFEAPLVEEPAVDEPEIEPPRLEEAEVVEPIFELPPEEPEIAELEVEESAVVEPVFEAPDFEEPFTEHVMDLDAVETEAADEPEPIEWVKDVSEVTPLGQQVGFGQEPEPPVVAEPSARPPVLRPTMVEGPVVDVDPEG